MFVAIDISESSPVDFNFFMELKSRFSHWGIEKKKLSIENPRVWVFQIQFTVGFHFKDWIENKLQYFSFEIHKKYKKKSF